VDVSAGGHAEHGAAVELEVVVPALNEERRLPACLDELEHRLAVLPLSAAVVVVDNGSTDGTAATVLRRPTGPVPVRLVSCAVPGKGAAVRAGVLSSDARWVGFTDADLATSLDCLPALVDALRGGADVVVGSRRLDLSRLLVQQQTVRRLGGWVFRHAASRVVPTVRDTQCGFKFFTADAGRRLFEPLAMTGWSFDIELLARAERQHLAVREIPVEWTNDPDSRFRAFADGARTFADLVRIRRLLEAEAAAQRPLAAVRGRRVADVP